MILEGVVTNVAAFGAFIDIGVHQDGLVHVSAMSRNFVSDPREVVKSGDVVRVRVLGVDADRKRISLTLRLDDEPEGSPRARRDAPQSASGPQATSGGGQADRNRGRDSGRRGGTRGGSPAGSRPGAGRAGGNDGGAMAEALRRAGLAGGTGDGQGGRPGS
jgi:uncharacterized protein